MPRATSPSLPQAAGQGAGITYQLAVDQHAAAPLGVLVFDGDKASAIFQVTSAPTESFPFTVSQSGTCSARPVVGTATSCTITETVTNTSNDPLDFSHTVANHLGANVRFVSATASTGSVTASGSNVVWSSFELAPHQSAQETVQISFTPIASQVGSAVILSNGITADALDVTTGKRYTISYGTLAINLTVAAASAAPASPTPTAGAAPPSPSSQPTTSQPGTSGLPTTGGSGAQVNLEYLAP